MPPAMRSTVAARDLNHLEARLRMPTDATVAKNRVASCDPSTAEVLPCSAFESC